MWVRLFEYPLYASVNWGTRIVTLPLLIAVLVEVFAAVFRPYSTLPNGTLRWFRTVVTALIFITAVAALCFPGHAPGDWKNTVMVLDRSASIIFCGAFGFTALFSSFFGIPWQHRTYGIGVGFLLFMSVNIFIASISATYGIAIAAALNAVSMLGYTLALITWIIYFAVSDAPSRTATLEQLKRLKEALAYTAQNAESYRELA